MNGCMGWASDRGKEEKRRMEYVFFRRLPGEGALNHKRRVLEKEGAFTGVCVRSRRTLRRKVHSMASQEENLFP